VFIIGKPTKTQKNLINFRTRAARKDETAKEPFDLDRVVWDPAYRRQVCDELNRAPGKGPERRPRPRRKAS
jgi:hypothetical protein